MFVKFRIVSASLPVFFRPLFLIMYMFAVSPPVSGETPPAVSKQGEFQKQVWAELAMVFPQWGSFQLTPGRETGPFVLYGAKHGDFEQVTCRQGVALSIVGSSGDSGGIQVSVCTEHRHRLARQAKNAEGALRGVLDAIGKVAPKIEDEKLRQAGWFYEKTILPDGTEMHYFPVLIVGHGIMVAYTVIVVGESHTIVVQAAAANLCHGEARDPTICTNAMGGLQQIAKRAQSLVTRPSPAP